MTGKHLDFLIIGAQKGGTTALDAYLSQHPGIYIPDEKELNYFAMDNKPLTWCGPGDDYPRKVSIHNQTLYFEKFKQAKQDQLTGESSVLYLFEPKAPEAIHRENPNMKLIAVLRNPVERAFSAYQHLRRDDREQTTPFAQALEKEKERIAAGFEPLWFYTSVGYYGKQLSNYYSVFPSEQIKIFLSEDLRADPIAVAQETYKFLNVAPTFVPDVDFEMNASGIPKLQFVNNFLNKPSGFKTIVKKLLPLKLGRKLKHKIQKSNLSKSESLEDATREKLKALYREDILKTQDLIGRDLSHWIK